MKRALLLILDGFGYSEKTENNAIALAETPTWDRLTQQYPMSLINTSGEAVGLPLGVMGNSEVGHITIGSGQIIYQDLTRISKVIAEGKLQDNEYVLEVSKQDGVLHLMGLLSDGGVHSHIDHLIGLVKTIIKINPEKEIAIHAITDGRDTSPVSGVTYIAKLQKEIEELPKVNLATVVGRFYAMDRDKRWDRVKVAYDALTISEGEKVTKEDLETTMKRRYDSEETDEFLKPIIIEGTPRISSGDSLLFFNFRADRAREITQALTNFEFEAFKNDITIDPKNYFTFTKYKENFPYKVLFPKQVPKNTLGEIVSKQGLKQLRIAETEKYAHVTYFFNGGVETEFSGEDRVLIPSPSDVKTYDEKPEMSVFEVTDKLVEALSAETYSLVVCNFANGDMVGHTGNKEAAIKAVEAIDKCLEKLVDVCRTHKYDIFLTADHGNCEEMVDQSTGAILTQHSTNPVPFLWVTDTKGKKLSDGGLADIAPTLLDFLGIKKPDNLDGRSLIT